VILALGFGHSWLAIWVLPLGFITGLTFAGFGLVMNSLARNYDFFTYSLTLFQTPMLLLSGVFFPVEQMPAPLQAVAAVLPLSHAIDIARPLLAGRIPDAIALHLAVLLAYAFATYFIALVLTRRRLLR
jgi:lipooligosaccharide transport system permease protein